jgi:prepilin-type processing-associated H-X9-DG protein
VSRTRTRLTRAVAFTLVELLVVIGIIAVLIAILLPTIAAARRQANTTACAATMRGLGQAFAAYTTEFKCYPWAVYYSDSSGGGDSVGDGGADPIDSITYVWWSVMRGYMRGHGAPINNAIADGSGRQYTRWMEAFNCPAANNRLAGCDFVCNGAIFPWQVYEGFPYANSTYRHPTNWAISKPLKPSNLYPDNIIIFDACELGDVDPPFSRQYVTSFDLDVPTGTTALSYTVNPKKPSQRYRGLYFNQNDPKLGDGFPIEAGPNNDGGGSGTHGNVRWRHGRSDLANFLFADGSVKTMKKTVGVAPNARGEVLRKYFRPKPPPGYNLSP